jgi:tetratricopeptide (TPR) repeat protein
MIRDFRRRGQAMSPRAPWLICLACLGCHAVSTNAPELASTKTANKMRAAPRQPLDIAPDHLNSAAACLTRGDEEQACRHLSLFVTNAPNHPNAKFFLAELLFQRGQFAAAREHYLQAIAACQDQASRDVQHLLHCHGRLLAVAQALEDEYEIQLQRGIGMALSAQLRANLGDPQGVLPVEALLFRAAACLTAAHHLQPDQARPCWYLHTVWRQLGQAQPAELWLRRAEAAAAFSYLTCAEQRGLQLAVQHQLLHGRGTCLGAYAS